MLACAESAPPPGAQAPGPDREIVEALERQDVRRAVALCARMYGPAIGRLCMAMVGSLSEAQELAQETLVIAHDALNSYRGEGTVRAFVFGIARRVCSRHLEMRTRREARLRLVHDAESPSDDALEALARQQQAARVRQALSSLRPTERESLLLRYQAGLSFREVAQACGVDEATARKRVSRALARLRTVLEEV